MKKLLGAFAITAAALATTTAFAENAAEEQRARLDKLWGKDTVVASQPAAATKNFTGISSTFRDQSIQQWATNFQGGRVHPPAGR